MPNPNFERLPKETLLQMIKNAPETRLFNSLFVQYKDSGEKKDVTNDGEYSCAFFVSGLLTLTGFIPRPHATVIGLRAKLLELSFTAVDQHNMEPGDIIFWDKIVFDNGSENEHVGFFLGENRAVSTSFKKHCVMQHDIDLPGGIGDTKRAITLVLRPHTNPAQQ